MEQFEIEIEIKATIKYSFSPSDPATHEDPGCPEEYEDIEIIALPFEDQPIDIQEYILEQCAEDVQTGREYLKELRFEDHIDRVRREV